MQLEHFLELRGALTRGRIPEQKYWNLQPFLDNQGLIRINSRITPHLECSRDAAHPILLHKNMKVVHVLLWEIHAVELRHCGGVNTLLAKVRTGYWIIRGPEIAREIVGRCLFCARLLSRTYKLPLPPLHLSRSGKPRKHCGAFPKSESTFVDLLQSELGELTK